MRRTRNGLWLALALAAFWGFASAVRADDPARKGEANVAVAQTLRTADIIGLPVRNRAGENLGKIDDLVIDMKSGEVRYAALSFGGFAGIGSKLFAVPWEKLMFTFGEPNKIDSRHVMFEVTKDQLDKAPGFDSSHWPNVADPQWAESIDKHYNVQRRSTAREGATEPRVAFETVFRASKVKGMEVRNHVNEHLGSIDELVIDVPKGHVKYIALSFGSALTGGNKLFAVPLAHCTLSHANDKTFLMVNVSQDDLKNAPGFDKSHWPDMANPNWSKETDTFFERTAQRPANRK
jgi:sporulation protein YlmC with PRC-barrel domain